MKRILMILILLSLLVIPVSAEEYTAPPVPDHAEQWMPNSVDSFGEGLLEILGKILPQIQPSMGQCLETCTRITAVVLLVSLVCHISGSAAHAAELSGTIAIGMLLLGSSRSLFTLGTETIRQISDYGKLLLPVMTSALAAGGSVSGSSALYLGTAFFDSLLSSAISVLLIPMLYVYLALSVADHALHQELLKQIKDFVKWLMTWVLKIILYLFTGYMTITGVVSGTTDTAALKAAKLTISGMIPVVGSILSDASEAVLVGAHVVRNAVGIYGLFAILSLWIGPFIQIGIQYLCLKLTAGICQIFGTKSSAQLISDFSGAMGLLLAMTGTVCLMLLISTVCFMKGVG